MIKNIILLFFLLILFLTEGCSKKHRLIVNVYYNKKAQLKLKEKLVFHDNDSVFIGDVRDLVVIKNRLYLSDRSNFKIHIFDNELHYIKSSPGQGRGPGEFTNVPFLAKDSNLLVASGLIPHVLAYLDSNFVIEKTIREPKKFMTLSDVRPVFDKRQILICAFNKIVRNKIKSYNNITTAMIINKKGNKIRNFCYVDDIYDKYIKSAFYIAHVYPIVSRGFSKSYFIIQTATTKFKQYDYNGSYIKTLIYRPRFYKTPPSYTLEQIKQMSLKDSFKKYYTKYTFLKSLIFDKKNNLLYLNYENMKMSNMTTRSLTGRDDYLVVINSSNECIYDDKIEGFMADVAGGIIYTVVKDNPLTINKYAVEIK